MVLLEEEKSNRDDDFANTEITVDDSADTEVTDDYFADTDRKYHVFGSWSAALQFARSEAKRLGKDTRICDNAKIIKCSGEFGEAAYIVNPNGKVHKDFSFWQSIFCLF